MEVNRATEGGRPGFLARVGDPGDREHQPDHSRLSAVPVVSPPNRTICNSRSRNRGTIRTGKSPGVMESARCAEASRMAWRYGVFQAASLSG